MAFCGLWNLPVNYRVVEICIDVYTQLVSLISSVCLLSVHIKPLIVHFSFLVMKSMFLLDCIFKYPWYTFSDITLRVLGNIVVCGCKKSEKIVSQKRERF